MNKLIPLCLTAFLLLRKVEAITPNYDINQYNVLFTSYQANLCTTQNLASFQTDYQNYTYNADDDDNSYFGFNLNTFKNISKNLANPSNLLPK